MEDDALYLAGASLDAVREGTPDDDDVSSNVSDSNASEEEDNEVADDPRWFLERFGEGVRVEIQQRSVPVADDGAAGRDGEPVRRDGAAIPRFEVQVQIQLHSRGRGGAAGPIVYDTSLPTQHSYLGPNFSRVTGGRVYQPGQVCRLPVYYSSAYLVPGRRLPFMCDTPRQTALVYHLTSGNDSMFAVVCLTSSSTDGRLSSRDDGVQTPNVGDIGCTAQLMSCNATDDDDTRAICKGIQRFRLDAIIPQTTGVVLVDVTILADAEPPAFPHRLLPARPQSYRCSPFRRFTPYKKQASCGGGDSLSRDCTPGATPAATAAAASSQADCPSGSHELSATETGLSKTPAVGLHVASEVRSSSGGGGGAENPCHERASAKKGEDDQTAKSECRALRWRHVSLLGPVPLQAFRLHSYERVVEQVFRDLLPWQQAQRLSRQELVPFSFYVMASMPLDHATQSQLLRLSSAQQRLTRVLQLMRTCRYYCCARCGHNIARREHIFSMSDDGPSALYVNPSNIITQMFTVRDTVSFSTAQLLPASAEFSWFPGYSWCSSICIGCNNHIGWSFETSDTALSPRQFFGLTQTSVVPDFVAPTLDDPQRQARSSLSRILTREVAHA